MEQRAEVRASWIGAAGFMQVDLILVVEDSAEHRLEVLFSKRNASFLFFLFP